MKSLLFTLLFVVGFSASAETRQMFLSNQGIEEYNEAMRNGTLNVDKLRNKWKDQWERSTCRTQWNQTMGMFAPADFEYESATDCYLYLSLQVAALNYFYQNPIGTKTEVESLVPYALNCTLVAKSLSSNMFIELAQDEVKKMSPAELLEYIKSDLRDSLMEQVSFECGIAI